MIKLLERVLKNRKIIQYLTVFKFLKYLKKFKTPLSILVFTNLISGILTLLSPLLTQALIDEAYKNKNWNIFYKIVLINAILILGIWIIGLVLSYFNTFLKEMLSFKISLKLQKVCSRMKFFEFHERNIGEHLYRQTNDVTNLTEVLASIFPQTLLIITQLTFFIIIAFKLQKNITFLFLLSLPVLGIIILIKNIKLRPLQKQTQEQYSDINNFHSQFKQGILTTKIFVKEKFEEINLLKVLKVKIKKVFQIWRMDTFYESLSILISGGWNAFVIYYGWSLVIKGELTLGSLVAIQMYLSRLAQPLQLTADLINRFVKGSVSAERVIESFSAEKETEGDKTFITKFNGKIKFEDVSFGYEKGINVLNKLNMEITEGSIVGITGPSGVGKTTAIHLLTRLFEINSGKITIDDIDISDMNILHLRQNVSIVPQEPFLYNMSIKENIRYGDGSITDNSIIMAAKTSNIHNFIQTTTKSYDTIIGKNGISVSIGQKQRLGLARALAKNAPVLILDEFTASLDSLAEANLFENIKTFYPNKTIVVISHKITNLLTTEKVYVLYKGTIAEEGSPKELLKKDGLFKKLYNLQYKFFSIQMEKEYQEIETEITKK